MSLFRGTGGFIIDGRAEGFGGEEFIDFEAKCIFPVDICVSIAVVVREGVKVGSIRDFVFAEALFEIDLQGGTDGSGTFFSGFDAVGSLVGEQLHLPGGKGAVRPEPGHDVEPDGVAHPVGDEGFLPGAIDADAAALDLGGAPGAQRLVQGVLLVAEAAADIGLYHPDVAPGAAQGLAHHPADDVGNLGGGHHGDAAVFLIGEAPVILNVAVLHRGGVVPALYLDEARLPDGGLIVALLHVGVLEDVVGKGLVELGRTGLHGLLGVQHQGKLLILHLQSPDALHGGHLVFRDDHGHVVAVVADVPVQKMPVRHVLVSRVHGPGVTGGGEGMLRHVEAGQDLYHAGDRLRSGLIHRLHEAVGNGGVLDAHIQRVPGHQILVIFGASGGLVKSVHPDLPFSNLSHEWCPPQQNKKPRYLA